MKTLNTFIAEELNDAQRSAVTQTSGELLVIAGAGSGKTRVITARIANLICNEDAHPFSIIALTFTNKAAREMQSRIAQFLDHDMPLPYVGTFHSYCLRLLKQYSQILGIEQFSILDGDDQQSLLQKIITRNDLKKRITARNAGYYISLFKNGANGGEEPSHDPIMLEVYKQYEAEKKVSNCFDFDDLLLETVKHFKKNPTFKAAFQERVKHVLVDEYQDTSHVQHALLQEMTKRDNKIVAKSVCVVGDEDQSIYSWRGATIDNIVHFKKAYPKASSVKIEQNYRSVKQILDTANSIIKNNVKRNPKKLWSDKPGTNRVFHMVCGSGYQEADAISYLISSLPKTVRRSDVAILYRTHFQSRSIEESLLKSSIAYKMIGGIQFYARKEIKDLLAYLRLIANPHDRVAFFRVINCPKRGLGPSFEELAQDLWHQEPLFNYEQLIHAMVDKKILTPKKTEAVRSFVTALTGITGNDNPHDALKKIINRLDYTGYLKDEFEPKEAEGKIDNLHELLRAAQHFTTKENPTIAGMLEEVALMQELSQEKENAAEQVQLMTLHAAKGLEFNTVMMAGMEEGLLPSTRSMDSLDAIEEERRLCYVGVTRACEYLFMFQASHRMTYGQTSYQDPSRFLEEITPALIRKEDCSFWKQWDFSDYFGGIFGTQRGAQRAQTFQAPPPPAYARSNDRSDSPKISIYKSSGWKRFQSVKHTKFGIGIVQLIEKNGAKTHLTIKFKMGLKKIDSSFIQII